MSRRQTRTDKAIDRLKSAIWSLASRIEAEAVEALSPEAGDRLATFDDMAAAAADILSLTAACAVLVRRPDLLDEG